MARIATLVLVLVLSLLAGCVRTFHEPEKADDASASPDARPDGARPDTAKGEGGPPAPDTTTVADALVCPKACNKGCAAGVCKIECPLSLSCLNKVVCPPNLPCDVSCGFQACPEVDCTKASHCRINCYGIESCAAGVTCGAGSCRVTCSGTPACAAGVDCQKSCSCMADCSGLFSCVGGVKCPSFCTACGPNAKCGSC